MGDWNEIIMGRSSMRRARPLILVMNALRRQEEEMERRPGINPGKGRGVNTRFRNWERVPRRENANMFMGRSRPFLAPPQVNAIRKQSHTQPCCLTLGYRSQNQPVAPTSHVSPNAIPPSCPNPTPPCPHQNCCLCHQLPPPPPSPQNDTKSTSSESEDSDESLSP